jgi:hypothetical protein
MVSTPFFSPTYTCMHSQAWDASHAMGAQFGTHLIGGFKVLRTYDRASGLRWRHRSCFRKRERELDGVFPNVNMKCGPAYSTQRHSLRLISPFHLLSPSTVLESLPKNVGPIRSPPAGDADGERPCRLGFSFREGAGAGRVAVSSHALEGAMDLWPRSDACR